MGGELDLISKAAIHELVQNRKVFLTSNLSFSTYAGTVVNVGHLQQRSKETNMLVKRIHSKLRRLGLEIAELSLHVRFDVTS